MPQPIGVWPMCSRSKASSTKGVGTTSARWRLTRTFWRRVTASPIWPCSKAATRKQPGIIGWCWRHGRMRPRLAATSVSRWRRRTSGGEAAAQYRRALALKPQLVDVHRNRGRLLLARGDTAEAYALARRALSIEETEETRAFFVQCAKSLLPTPAFDELRDDLRDLVARALSEGWSRPSELSRPAQNLF